MAGISVDERFETLLRDVVSSLDGEPEQVAAIGKSVTERLRKEWAAPRTDAISTVLGRTLTDDEARELIFFPKARPVAADPDADVDVGAAGAGAAGAAGGGADRPMGPGDWVDYIKLLAVPAGSADAGPASSPSSGEGPSGGGDGGAEAEKTPHGSALLPALALLYLRHAKTWASAKYIVTGGGLPKLVALFEHSNEYIRSQAVDVFLQITSADEDVWFTAPTTDEARAVHAAMLAVARQAPFFRALAVTNRHSPVPQVSYFCLQILAFWLSWARLRHTGSRPLCLSQALLDALKQWGSDMAVPEQERKLATQVHGDFLRFGSAEKLADSERAAVAKERVRRNEARRAEAVKHAGPGDSVTVEAIEDGDADLVGGKVEGGAASGAGRAEAVPADDSDLDAAKLPSDGESASDGTGVFVSVNSLTLGAGDDKAAPGSEGAPIIQADDIAPPRPPTVEERADALADRMREVRNRGNELYGAEPPRLEAAVAEYSEAIALVEKVDGAERMRVRKLVALDLAAAYSNRAAALLRLGLQQQAAAQEARAAHGGGSDDDNNGGDGGGGGDTGDADSDDEPSASGGAAPAGHAALEQCLDDCSRALVLDPDYVKVAFRKAQVLRAMQRYGDARAAAQVAKMCASKHVANRASAATKAREAAHAKKEAEAKQRKKADAEAGITGLSRGMGVTVMNTSADKAQKALPEIRQFIVDMEVEQRIAQRRKGGGTSVDDVTPEEAALMAQLLKRGDPETAAAYVKRGAVGSLAAPRAPRDGADGPASVSSLSRDGAAAGGTAQLEMDAYRARQGGAPVSFGQLGEAVDPALGRAAVRAHVPDPRDARARRRRDRGGDASSHSGAVGRGGAAVGTARGVVGVMTLPGIVQDGSLGGNGSGGGAKVASKGKGKGKGKGSSKSGAGAAGKAPRVVGYGAVPDVPPSKSQRASSKAGKAGKAGKAKAATKNKAAAAAAVQGSRKVAALQKALRTAVDAGDMAPFAAEVRSIEPSTYAQVFQLSLSESLLMGMVSGLTTFVSSEPSFVVDALAHLADVPRFSTMLMFLSSDDKDTVAELFGDLRAAAAKAGVAGVDEAASKWGVEDE